MDVYKLDQNEHINITANDSEVGGGTELCFDLKY